jgi:hypothetical protein
MARPYSVRDLRSVFCTAALTRDFFGDYDFSSRRWRFASAESAHQAAAFLASTGPVVSLHDTDAIPHADGVRARGGFSVVARNDAGTNRRGTGFYLFRTEDQRFEAERFLYERTRAGDDLRANALAQLDGVPAECLPESPAVLRERLVEGRPSIREAVTIAARAAAARATLPPSDAARCADRDALLAAAAVVEPGFAPTAPVADGRIIGILAAKSEYHLAVLVESAGRGVVLERGRVAMPLAHQYPRERAFDTRHIIGIDLERGFGRALQLRGEQDPHFGGMRMSAALAARDAGVLPILQEEEWTPHEDLTGTLVGADDTLAVALDAGAYAIIGTRAAMPGAIGAAVQSGPSFAPARPLLRRRA